MRRRIRSQAARYALFALALGLIIGVLAAVTIASGAYNVAASRGHMKPTEWLLHFVMRRSVANHSRSAPSAPPLDDPELVALGASHFHWGCASCHGAPGVRRDAVSANMLPPPPDLTGVAQKFSDRELYWIVRHGIKYTGMPAWPAADRTDEPWAVVAFLRRLSDLNEARYRELIHGAVDDFPAPNRDDSGDIKSLARNCAMCHGDGARAPSNRFTPSLGGQREAYLATALRAYARGERQSGFMQPHAASLSNAQIDALADYFSASRTRRVSAFDQETETLAIGRRIAQEGQPRKGVPACDSCHGDSRLDAYPSLDGLSETYIRLQLRLWREGGGRRAGEGAIMAPIAERLDEDAAQAVARYYAAGGDTQDPS